MSAYLLQPRKLAAICTSLTLLFLLYLGTTGISSEGSARTFAGSHSGGLDDISNSTLGFQKIYVINLPSRPDRKDSAVLAAAYTGLQVDFVDAVTETEDKVAPPGMKKTKLNRGSAANWRSHMNVLRQIVEQNITTALILEDDADWDIRIKSQMRDFAKASRLLVQPLPGTNDRFLDPTWPRPDSEHQSPVTFNIHDTTTGEPTTSPYGDVDRWQMLWLGHCGCRFPWADDKNVPLARAMIPNDVTVPSKNHVNIEFGDSQLLDQYPEHTRVVSRSRVNTCTLGVAVTQEGARHMLYELAVHKVDGTTDMMYRSLCDGAEGRSQMTCLSPQPALFNHHRPVAVRNTFSDIGDFNDEAINEIPHSTNIRWAARVNLPKLMNHETDYIDTFPD